MIRPPRSRSPRSGSRTGLRIALAAVVLLVSSVAGTRGAETPPAARGGGPGEADAIAGHARGWLLVKLSEALPPAASPGELSLRSGRPALDAALRAAGVERIVPALRASARSSHHRQRRARAGLDRIYRFHVPPGADVEALARAFAAVPGVEWAEPDRVGRGGATTPNDTRFSDQWAYAQGNDADVDGPEAWDRTTGGPVVIAVLDSGIDSDHPDLAAKIEPGWDFVNDDADPEDDHVGGGHGSSVSSIAAAVTDNAAGIAGTCWGCRIMPLKVLNQNNFGSYSDFADAMVWATDQGADVINLSAGGATANSILEDGVRYAWFAGVVVVSITHNQNIGTVYFPAAYPETIAVGATDQVDQRADPLCIGGGSNWGPEIDVVAPGDFILSANRSGGYSDWCGTSQAAPLVAGLVGLMRTLNPALGREEARHLLRSGGEDEVGRPSEDTPGFDEHHGWGRVNMDRTLQAVESALSLRVEGHPTRVWLATPNALASSYDILRGPVSALAEDIARVDLGPARCLEDDSPDPDLAGNEDAALPNPGAARFYLIRPNTAAGSGSYGGSTLNRDRQALQLQRCLDN